MVEQQMTECIDNCTECYRICFQTAMNHCLDNGGKHTEPNHFRLMLNCAKVCEASAYFQLSVSPFCADICALCEKICTVCADNCEQMGGMDECVTVCRKCAASCRKMAA